MEPTSRSFKANAQAALKNPQLKLALGKIDSGFVANRARAARMLPEFDRLRDQSRDIKDHTLAHLDLYLEAFEEKVEAAGGHVHWAKDAEHACTIVTGLCREYNVGLVTKSKSMISEEIALNDALEETGIEVVETDLGEYIIQIRKEPPSHIIAPAIHLNRDQIEADFRKKHDHLPKDRVFAENADLVAEARLVLRDKFLNSDVGITGANFLVAQTGSVVIVTNEGNADLTQTIAPVHIVIASIEKMVPTLEDATTILRVLARSATGQDFSSYTTVTTGPKRAGDPDGPEHFHIVLLDNGRSNMLGTEFQDMLRCIRCGACMNHCPVYSAIGGHAYGWVYPGPMGAVLTPALIGIDQAGSLPNASTFCGRCEAVCPMRIELPRMMRHWREHEFERHLAPNTTRYGLLAWRFVASRPKLYHILVRVFAVIMNRIAGKRGRLRFLPLARGWTKYRDFPAPEGDSFQALWRKHRDKGS